MQPVLAKSATSRARKVHLAHQDFEKQLKSYLIGELKALRAAVPTDDLASVLHAAKDAEIFELIDAKAMKGVFVGMNDMLVRGTAAGAKGAADEVGRVAVLDAARPRISKWLKEHSAELVKQLNDTSRGAVRAIVRAGVESGRHPKKLAEDVRSVIGLTEQQATAVARRRAYLLSGDAQWKPGEVVDPLDDRPRSWPARTGMTPERANQLADKYADQLLTQRAENIARTESLTAVNHGRVALWDQLVSDGAMKGQQEWDASGDRAVCEKICRPMHGKRVPLGAEWELPDGATVIAPPGHPSCRCVVRLVTED